MASRRKKISVAVAIVLLCAPVLYVGCEALRGKRALAAWVKEAQVKGEVFDTAALAPPALPSEKNGAMSLISVARPPPGGVGLNCLHSQQYVSGGKVIAMLPLEEWSELFRDEKAAATNLNWTAAVAEVALNGATIQKIQAVVRQGGLNFNVEYRQGFSYPLTHLTSLKPVSQWLAVVAMVELRQGRTEPALEALVDAMAYVRMQKDEPLLISQLVRAACFTITVNATWQALQAPGWTEPQLARLQQAWTTNSFPDAMLAALVMERAMVRMEFVHCRRDTKRLIDSLDSTASLRGTSRDEGTGLWAVFNQMVEPMRPALRRNVYGPLWSTAWSELDELRYLKLVQQLLDQSRLAVGRRSLAAGGLDPTGTSTDIWDSINSPASQEGGFRYPLSSQLDFEILSNAVKKAFRMETLRELTMTAIALRRHQIVHGRYPETLGGLVPGFLAEAPRDFMNGQPLQYRLKPDGTYLLYSVGDDLKDGGGDTASDHGPVPRSLTDGRDLVWPWPASRAEMDTYIDSQKKGGRK